MLCRVIGTTLDGSLYPKIASFRKLVTALFPCFAWFGYGQQKRWLFYGFLVNFRIYWDCQSKLKYLEITLTLKTAVLQLPHGSHWGWFILIDETLEKALPSALTVTWCIFHWTSAIIVWCSKLQRSQGYSWPIAASAWDGFRQFWSMVLLKKVITDVQLFLACLFLAYWGIYSGWIDFHGFYQRMWVLVIGNGLSMDIGSDLYTLDYGKAYWDFILNCGLQLLQSLAFSVLGSDCLQNIMKSWIAWSPQCQVLC